MSDTKDSGNKPSGGSDRRPLSLKGSGSVGAGTVRQSFSHGRSKPVVVEKRRKRILGKKDAAKKTVEKTEAPAAPAPQAAPEPQAPEEEKTVLRTLTETEREARAKALEEAKAREVIEKKEAKERAIREAEEEERRAAEREAEAARRAEEDAKRTEEEKEAAREAEARAKREAEEEAARIEAAKAEASAAAAEPNEAAPRRKVVSEVKDKDKDNDAGGRVKKKPVSEKPVSRSRNAPRRRSGKLTIARALDDNERQRSLASVRRAREREKRQAQGLGTDQKQVVREVVVPDEISVRDLSDRMAIRAVDVVKVLMKQGQMATVNDMLDPDTAQLIAEEYGHTVKRVAESDVEDAIVQAEDREEDLLPRAPVVTVMGHVDHGKTSLLDAIRKSDVAEGEAGGITQHIGAYQVTMPSHQKITFLDTPGHAAFTQMRARGAKVTDIVVLVVAADDGVMPQTVEAINHAKAAEVPIIVAINKMDKPGVDPMRVKQELLQYELIVEDMGGEVQTVEVSAKTKMGIETLEEAILLQAEILELKANPNRTAAGSVVEAKLDKGRGPVATILVQNGTLKTGDIFVAGAEWGKVRALINDRGETVNEAGPAVPVEVLGLNGTPMAGDDIVVVESEARAREVTEYRQRKDRDAKSALAGGSRASLDQMFSKMKEANIKEVPLVIKADVQGSVEAIIGALDKLSTDEVRAKAVQGAVGGISESDILLAASVSAPVIGFNVRASGPARALAEKEGVEIRYYSVIYDLVDDVKAAMSGLLDPTLRENFLGNAEILEVFNITKVGRVAGCRITEGVVRRGAKVRLIRDSVVIHEGTLSTLKRFKDEVKEVQTGQECGMAFENYQDIQPGDVIECFEVETIERTL
ncbi:MAG: translation initiation factor IF-2 [Alphaproteobacteria bacterium]|nr:MAG: translation initiation factor IF-2 [Alphaproteobacteria bacterium]